MCSYGQNCLFFYFEIIKENSFFSKFLTKNNAGALQNPNGITQSPILEVFGQNVENYQKSAWNIFHALTRPKCKVSEQSNERFPRKNVMYGRTDSRDS